MNKGEIVNNISSISAKIDTLKVRLERLYSSREKCDNRIRATKEKLAELHALNMSIARGNLYTVTYDREKYQCEKIITVKVTRFYCTDTCDFCVVGEDKSGIEWWFYPEIKCTFRTANASELDKFLAEIKRVDIDEIYEEAGW